jgi:hypothetical protein
MRSLIAVAVACCVVGQVSASQVSSMFRSTSHDFGTVARAAKTEHRFEFVNPYSQPLHVKGVRTSCGCTTPIVETETVAPGGKGVILARFNTGTHTGQKAATVTVSFDRPQYMEVQLNVKGYIRSDVVVNPGEITFSNIREGTGAKAQVEIDYAGRSDWQIVGVSSQDGFLNGEAIELSRSGGRVKYQLTASLGVNAPAGILQTELIINTNDRRLTKIPVRVNATIQPDIAVTPQTMALGPINPGDSIQKVFIVRGHQPFLITDVNSSEFDIRFDPIKDPKPLHTLPLTLSPKNGSGDVTGKIYVKTNLPGAQTVEVGASYSVPK